MSGLIPTYRGPVNAWECDLMGHMNVQFYVAKASDAAHQLYGAIGAGPGYQRRSGCRFVSKRERIQYRREAVVGDIVEIESGLRSIGESGLAFVSVMRNALSGEAASWFETEVRHIAAETGEEMPLPADIGQRAAELMDAGALPPGPDPMVPPIPPDDPAPGVFESARGAVDTWECDFQGFADDRYYMGRFSSALSYLMSRYGMSLEKARNRGLGSAALDYDIRFSGALKAGEPYVVRSRILGFKGKTYHLAHYLSEAVGERPVAVAKAVGVFFDLKARKAVEVPEYMVAGFKAMHGSGN